MWTLRFLPRPYGWWCEFVNSLATMGGQLADAGILRFRLWNLTLHVDMPLSAWKHACRFVLRCFFAGKAHASHPVLYPPPDLVDWPCVALVTRSQPRTATCVTHAVNSLDRACRHFRAIHPAENCCEHGCLQRDTAYHRGVACPATAPLRIQCGIDERRLDRMHRRPLCTKECLIWTAPGPEDEFPPALQNLWLCEAVVPLLQQAARDWHSGNVDGYPAFCLSYASRCSGRHPWNRKHAASLSSPNLPGWNMPIAFGTHDQVKRLHWDCSACLVASQLVNLLGCPVSVRGVHNPIAAIVGAFRSGEAPQAHFLEDVLRAQPQLQLDRVTPVPATPDVLALLEEQPERVRELEDNFADAAAWSRVYAESFDLFPHASAIAHSRGRAPLEPDGPQPMRGGVQTCVHVCTYSPLACAPTHFCACLCCDWHVESCIELSALSIPLPLLSLPSFFGIGVFASSYLYPHACMQR